MDFLPFIFIGSSSEALPVAKVIRDRLDGFATCSMWTDVFDFGKSYLENLTQQVTINDYAILVATGDDTLISRTTESAAVRDNVLFEFGLFSGGLGTERVFYLREEGSSIPSDMLGISLPTIPKRSHPDFSARLAEVVLQIRRHIEAHEQVIEPGFFPSTALAFGYFVNFVERSVQRLLEDRAAAKVFSTACGQSFSIESIQLTVLIPNDLRDDMFKKVVAKRLREGWQKIRVDPQDVRDYDFSIDISKAAKGALHLVDIPLTLNALNESLHLYTQAKHIGQDKRERVLEQREIRNFKRTLEYLIRRSAITRGIVSVELVDI